MPIPYCNKEASSRARIAYKHLKKAEAELTEYEFNGPFRTDLGYPFYIVNIGHDCISLLFIKPKGAPLDKARYRVFSGFGCSDSRDTKHHARSIPRLRALLQQM